MSSLIRPVLLTESELIKLVSKLYGLNVKLVKELNSYDDRNYLLKDVSANPSRNFVFKVLNSVDSKEPEKIDIQNDIILFAKQAGYPLTAPIINLEGQYQKIMSFENKTRMITENSLVRLFEYIPGTTLNLVNLTKSLCNQIGQFAGWLDKIFKSYTKHGQETTTFMTREWNLSEVPTLRKHLYVVEGPKRRSIIEEVISSFEQDVLPLEHTFSRGFIHSDINDNNLIVSESTTGDIEEVYNGNGVENNDGNNNNNNSHHNGNGNGVDKALYDIVAVIDFGDVSYSCHLYEVAIAMAYVVINEFGIPPLEAAACLLDGYMKHIKLSDKELEMLKTCLCARLSQSIVLGLVTLKANPDNIYNLCHSSRMWEPLEQIWRMSNKEFLQEILLKQLDDKENGCHVELNI